MAGKATTEGGEILRITELRERAGMTQTQLADKLGVDNSTVCKWETGVNSPMAKSLFKLADLFGCSIDEICGREPPGRSSA